MLKNSIISRRLRPSFLMQERKRNDELGVNFKGFEEEQALALMAFLELEKYNKGKIQELFKKCIVLRK